MSECNHDCSSCGEACEHRIEKVEPAKGVKIKHIIGVVSGKGGVGKSLVTSSLAASLAKQGHKVGILDADVTGPSIPSSFGIKGAAMQENELILPLFSKKYNIAVMSAGLLLDDNEEPIIWRGPMIGNLVKQLFTQVNWQELEYLLIDMPPGTSDVALTIFQYLPVDGVVIVSSPQALVTTIVAKAINMANQMNVKVLGLIENMSYVECKKCNEKNYVFGESHAEYVCGKYGISLLGKLPLREDIASLIDKGNVEEISIKEIDEASEKIISNF